MILLDYSELVLDMSVTAKQIGPLGFCYDVDHLSVRE